MPPQSWLSLESNHLKTWVEEKAFMILYFLSLVRICWAGYPNERSKRWSLTTQISIHTSNRTTYPKVTSRRIPVSFHIRGVLNSRWLCGRLGIYFRSSSTLFLFFLQVKVKWSNRIFQIASNSTISQDGRFAGNPRAPQLHLQTERTTVGGRVLHFDIFPLQIHGIFNFQSKSIL